jgi:hypothetical protein
MLSRLGHGQGGRAGTLDSVRVCVYAMSVDMSAPRHAAFENAARGLGGDAGEKTVLRHS